MIYWFIRRQKNVGLAGILLGMDGLEFSETYASNVFPFIKHGKKNSSIRDADMLYAAKKYALLKSKLFHLAW